MSGLQIPAASFEGLFIRALGVSGPIVEKLKAVGFDPARREASDEADPTVWVASVKPDHFVVDVTWR